VSWPELTHEEDVTPPEFASYPSSGEFELGES
jgi:hypothetical protein